MDSEAKATYKVEELGHLDLVEPAATLVLPESTGVADSEGVGA